jgi:hypothetical protein
MANHSRHIDVLIAVLDAGPERFARGRRGLAFHGKSIETELI